MARGIYKRTMNRGISGEPDEQDSGDKRSATSPGEDDAEDGHSENGGAASLVGQRTLYVDRQVARRARSRSKTKRIRRLKTFIALLVLSHVLVIMGWIFAWAKMQAAEERAVLLDADLRKTEIRLEEARADLEKRETEMLSLVENRIPGLSEIVFNNLLDINDQYVQNITFSEAGVEENKTLEYHAMLINDSNRMVLPQVKIFVFNEFGLQVGKARLEKRHATSPVTLEELEPGETRSYHAQIEMEFDDAPKYYMLDVK